MSLLTGLLSKIEKAKKLPDHNTEDSLLEFFDIQLTGRLNFGRHQVFIDGAAERKAETKAKLTTRGKEIQQLVQTGRENTIAAARIKLQACSEDLKTLGEHEWMSQCGKNVATQHSRPTFCHQMPPRGERGHMGRR